MAVTGVYCQEMESPLLIFFISPIYLLFPAVTTPILPSDSTLLSFPSSKTLLINPNWNDWQFSILEQIILALRKRCRSKLMCTRNTGKRSSQLGKHWHKHDHNRYIFIIISFKEIAFLFYSYWFYSSRNNIDSSNYRFHKTACSYVLREECLSLNSPCTKC